LTRTPGREHEAPPAKADGRCLTHRGWLLKMRLLVLSVMPLELSY
jgi:hypothetical protein